MKYIINSQINAISSINKRYRESKYITNSISIYTKPYTYSDKNINTQSIKLTTNHTIAIASSVYISRFPFNTFIL